MLSGPTEVLHERQVIFRPLEVTNYKNFPLTPYIFGYTPDVKTPQTNANRNYSKQLIVTLKKAQLTS